MGKWRVILRTHISYRDKVELITGIAAHSATLAIPLTNYLTCTIPSKLYYNVSYTVLYRGMGKWRVILRTATH